MSANSETEWWGRRVAGRTIAIAVTLTAMILGFAPEAYAALSPTSGKGSSSANHDARYAKAELVTLANLPNDWSQLGTVQVGTSDGTNSSSLLTTTQIPALTACMGLAAPLTVVAKEASSPTFTDKGQTMTVYNVADVYLSAAQAKVDFPPFGNVKFVSCFAEVQGGPIANFVQSEYDPGTVVGTPTSQLVSFPKFGNQSVMVELQFPLTQPDGTHDTEYYNVLLIRQGRSTAELDFDTTGTPVGVGLTTSLAKMVTMKMKETPSH
jgi:hypothetical protein